MDHAWNFRRLFGAIMLWRQLETTTRRRILGSAPFSDTFSQSLGFHITL